MQHLWYIFQWNLARPSSGDRLQQTFWQLNMNLNRTAASRHSSLSCHLAIWHQHNRSLARGWMSHSRSRYVNHVRRLLLYVTVWGFTATSDFAWMQPVTVDTIELISSLKLVAWICQQNICTHQSEPTLLWSSQGHNIEVGCKPGRHTTVRHLTHNPPISTVYLVLPFSCILKPGVTHDEGSIFWVQWLPS